MCDIYLNIILFGNVFNKIRELVISYAETFR